MPHRLVRARAAVALLATAAVTTTLLATLSPAPAGADESEQPTAGRAQGRALAAVAQVRAIFDSGASGDLTMALREVANTRSALSGADREAADDLLARPTAGGGDGTLGYGGVREAKPVCTKDICVHYVTRGRNAVSTTDRAPRNRVPDYVDLTLRTLKNVHDAYLRAGYREPKADGSRGGNAKIDVYLGQLGDRGVYGYCTSDDPDPSEDHYDRWAYCALDNDYREFGRNTPVDNLRVTVAHEYFHATQYAYDRYEDGWILEATAAWVEDEMYDAVNDNLQYLPNSPMRRPGVPLDTFDTSGDGFHYGTWSYFRFLTERYPAKKGRLPRLVLDIWRRLDGARGRPDDYSWQGINRVLRTKRTTGAAMLGAYAVANRRPAARYAEGRANNYPTAPLRADVAVTSQRVAQTSFRLNHLTTATTRYRPQGLLGTGWKLALAFDLPPLARGSSALVTTVDTAGRATTRRVKLDADGDGRIQVGFSAPQVASVEATVVNGSGRFDCFVRSAFSCQGRPLDNALPTRLAVAAFR